MTRHKFGEYRWPPAAPDDGSWIVPLIVSLMVGLIAMLVLISV